MDDIGGDDWTYDDDSFDYNKRLQSDEEDTNDQESLEPPDPNWADQVEKHGSQSPAQYQGYYDENKALTAYEDIQDDRRRNKKSEEVMKNIERARKRKIDTGGHHPWSNKDQILKMATIGGMMKIRN